MSLETMSEVISRHERAGYVGSFATEEGGLRGPGCGRRHAARDAGIGEIVRFEGDSDPADEAALFALDLRALWSKGDVRHGLRPSHGAR